MRSTFHSSINIKLFCSSDTCNKLNSVHAESSHKRRTVFCFWEGVGHLKNGSQFDTERGSAQFTVTCWCVGLRCLWTGSCTVWYRQRVSAVHCNLLVCWTVVFVNWFMYCLIQTEGQRSSL